MSERIAETFLSLGIQNWGQTAEQRQKATDDYLRAAGFDLGTGREAADIWLKDVLRNLRRGEYYDEADQLRAALEARKAYSANG